MLSWPIRNHPIEPPRGRIDLRKSLLAGVSAMISASIPPAAFGALIIGATADPLSRAIAGVWGGLAAALIVAIPSLIGAHLMHAIVRRLCAINHVLTTLTGAFIGSLLMVAIGGEWLSFETSFAAISGAFAALAASIYLHLALAYANTSQRD